MVEIEQGTVVATEQSGRFGEVIINPEVYAGAASAARIISEKPPRLARPGTILHAGIQPVLGVRWSRNRILTGWKNSGLVDPASPDVKAELDEGKRKGRVKIR